jgi:hypothetical protein
LIVQYEELPAQSEILSPLKNETGAGFLELETPDRDVKFPKDSKKRFDFEFQDWDHGTGVWLERGRIWSAMGKRSEDSRAQRVSVFITFLWG